MLLNRVLRGLIRVYQLTLSPLLALLDAAGGGCRFEPTCSRYCMQALAEHGTARGLWLGINGSPVARPGAGWDSTRCRRPRTGAENFRSRRPRTVKATTKRRAGKIRACLRARVSLKEGAFVRGSTHRRWRQLARPG